MRLTLHTDYALRVLIYLAAAGSQGATAGTIADRYRISKNHLVKVIQRLVGLGYLETTRGRGGGVRLARPPSEILVGEVVRRTEDSLDLVECFDLPTNTCPLARACLLKAKLHEALAAYLAVLDACSIAEVATNGAGLMRLLEAAETS
jgi:Rrf2 family transcriptional regulator, nitric oxide-sensitive transcriptional repressor